MPVKRRLLTVLLVCLVSQPPSAGDLSAPPSVDPHLETTGAVSGAVTGEAIDHLRRDDDGDGMHLHHEGITLLTQAGEDTAPLNETTGAALGSPLWSTTQTPQSATPAVTADSDTAGEEERIRSLIIVIAWIILIMALLVLIFLLIRKGKGMRAGMLEAEAYLNDTSGCTSQMIHKLGERPVMVGRVAGKHGAHLDYLVIPEPTVGRRHALIEYKDFGFWLRDQGSINGTFVNDGMIKTETRLKHRDKVRFHLFEFEFFMPEMGEGKTEISHGAISAQTAATSDDGFIDISGGMEAPADGFAEEDGVPEKEATLPDVQDNDKPASSS